MHIQNYFPILTKTEMIIQKRVEKVRDEEKDKRPDLQVLAASYLGILKQKSAHLIEEKDFHHVVQSEQAVNGDKTSNIKFN